MRDIYLSTYCVAFQDYPWLAECIRTFPDFPVGVEFATSWTTPNFDENLVRQIPVFSHLPITLHAPFVEECTIPGSPEAVSYTHLHGPEGGMSRLFYK